MIVGVLLKLLAVMSSTSRNKHSFHHLALRHLAWVSTSAPWIPQSVCHGCSHVWCVEMCHMPSSKIRSASRDMRTKPWPKTPARTAYIETTTRTSLRDLSQTPCSVHRSRPVKTSFHREDWASDNFMLFMDILLAICPEARYDRVPSTLLNFI